MRGCGWRGRLGTLAVILLFGWASVPAPVPADPDGRFGRWSASGYAEGAAVIRSAADSTRQRPAGILDAAVDGELGRYVRTHAELRGIVGGTPENAEGFGFFDLRGMFQDISPSLELEEAYVDVSLSRLDLRIGKQKIAWGRLDTFHPTDVVTPRRYTDPFMDEEEVAKIGVPAVRAAYYLPSFAVAGAAVGEPAVSVVWVPVPVLARFPTADERWFPSSAGVPDTVVLKPEYFPDCRLCPSSDVTVHNRLQTKNTHAPWQFEEGSVGVRLSANVGGADAAAYYYEGTQTAPILAYDTVIQPPAGLDLTNLDATATLRPRYGRMRLFGADAAFPFGGFTARAEAAFTMNRLLPRSTEELLSEENLASQVGPDIDRKIAMLLRGKPVAVDLGDLFLKRDTAEWGVGVDYAYRGWTPVLQLNQTLIRDNHTRLLINDVDTRLFAALRKGFLDDRLDMDLVAFQGCERSYTGALARFTYDVTDELRLRAGYLLVAGTRQSLVGVYHDNDQFFVQLRYSR